MKKILPLFLLSILFTSCIWIPEEGFDEKCQKLSAKPSLKDFTSLEDPILLKKGLYSNYSLALSPTTGSYTSLGNIYLVYDWKTDTFYDWCFVSKKYEPVIGMGRLLQSCIGKDSSNCYVDCGDYDDQITILSTSPENKFKKIDLSESFRYSKNNSYKSKYFLTYINAYNKPKGFKIFNTEKDQTQTFVHLPEDRGSWVDACADPNGNFWLLSEDEGTVYISEIDSLNDIIKSPAKTYNKYAGYSKNENNDYEDYDYYKILFADDKYVYIERYQMYHSDGNPYVLLALDKETGTDIEIDLTDSRNKCNILSINKINGKIYVTVRNYYENFANIYTLDISSKTMTKVYEEVPCLYGAQVVERGDKLYLFNLETKGMHFYSFDTSNNSMSNKKIIDLDEIINN